MNETHALNSPDQGGEYYDAPRKLVPSPSRSPITTDAESVFTDDEWSAPIPSVNWETFPPPGESKGSLFDFWSLKINFYPHFINLYFKYNAGKSKPSNSNVDAEIGSWSVRKRFGKLRIVDSSAPPVEEVSAPPRPPKKPAHMLLDSPGHNYLNLDGATESTKPTTPSAPVTPSTPAPSTPATALITDETYDFPRSHQPENVDSGTLGKLRRHCYTNAAPTNSTGK